MNAKHGPVIIGISQIAVNNKRHLILLLSKKHAMHISVLKLLPCTINHAIKSMKIMPVNNSTSH